jgi:hypothetical protein
VNRTRTLLAICALALPVIAGCGGDDDGGSDVDPQTVIDETFSNEETVSSGDLSLSFDGSAEGDQGGSFEASLSGPFQGDPDNPNAIPQLDWTGSISGEGAGQSISFEGAVVITEDNAFVEYGGNAYEVGTEMFSQFKELAESAAAQQTEAAEGQSFGELFTQSCETQLEAQGGDTAACDIDFQSWLGDLTNEGEEEIEGAETIHVSGTLETETMIQDLVELGTAVPQASGTVPTEEQVQQVSDAITEASFDLYSGADDRILRGLDFNFALDPSEIPDAEAAAVDSIDAGFSMRLGGVNEDQTIEAPSDAQPLEDLLSQFGVDPSALGGLGALGAGGLGGLGTPPASGGGGGGGAGASDAYLECISSAQTPEEITACANEL